MLDYCIDHYDIDGASLAYGEKEALGQAVAGAGKELTEYMLEHYTGLIELAEPDQVMKAGNVPLLRYLLENACGRKMKGILLSGGKPIRHSSSGAQAIFSSP